MKRVRRSKSKGGGSGDRGSGRGVLGFSLKSSSSRMVVERIERAPEFVVGSDFARVRIAVRVCATVSAMPPRTALVIMVVRTGLLP